MAARTTGRTTAGWVGPSVPLNGVHVKIFGAMSSR